jgi:hypothetical protein
MTKRPVVPRAPLDDAAAPEQWNKTHLTLDAQTSVTLDPLRSAYKVLRRVHQT